MTITKKPLPPLGDWFCLTGEWVWCNYFWIEGVGWVSQLDWEWTMRVNNG